MTDPAAAVAGNVAVKRVEALVLNLPVLTAKAPSELIAVQAMPPPDAAIDRVLLPGVNVILLPALKEAQAQLPDVEPISTWPSVPVAPFTERLPEVITTLPDVAVIAPDVAVKLVPAVIEPVV
jgi:hypothetical protein